MVYLKNFCFKDAVKVEQFIINNEVDYAEKILMKNIFADYNSTFCLLQQITLDKNEKYFIFGIKFNDIFIPDNKKFKDNKIKFFIIEKTYLFISSEPLCKLFENIFRFIIVYKKLLFFKNLIDYNSLNDIDKIKQFNEMNQENVRINIFIFNLG